jgi:hypothetical protein
MPITTQKRKYYESTLEITHSVYFDDARCFSGKCRFLREGRVPGWLRGTHGAVVTKKPVIAEPRHVVVEPWSPMVITPASRHCNWVNGFEFAARKLAWA